MTSSLLTAELRTAAGGVLRAGWFTHDPSDLPAIPDWTLLVRYLCRSGLAGVGLTALRSVDAPVPMSARDELAAVAASVAAANLHIRGQWQGLAAAFAAARIDVMTLKGVALVDQLYDRLECRPMGDIDLLVRRADAGRAVALLERQGCRSGRPLLRSDAFPTEHNEIEYLTAGTPPVKIDLHAHPFRPLRFQASVPADGLWVGAEGATVLGGDCWVPTPARALVHLCVHAALHGAERLLWLLDIGLLAHRQRGTIDWADFLHTTQAWQVGWPVCLAVQRAEERWGKVVPDPVRAELAALRPAWRDRLAVWHASRDDGRPLRHLLVDLAASGSPGLAWRRLGSFLCPGRAHLGTLYPWRHPGWWGVAQVWRLLRWPLGPLFRRVAVRSADPPCVSSSVS